MLVKPKLFKSQTIGMSMPIISFINNKGSVGKSTLTINLAGALTEAGYKILAIDLDSQANLSYLFIDNVHTLALTVSEVINGESDSISAIQATKIDNLAILPSKYKMQDIDSKLAGDDAQFFLADELETIKSDYDFILIDCPLRCPIIPGINDTSEHHDAILRLEMKYPNIEK